MIHNPSNQAGVVMRSPKLWHVVSAVAVAVLAVLLGSSVAFASGGNTGFGFNARDVSGGSGSVFLTGGGAFNSTSGFVHSAGGFKCTSTVSNGPLAGCLAGQGVRWDTAALLRSTPFKCTATDPLGVKTATTTDDTAVLQADFYRAGDGNNESFTANMIVSAHDIAPDVPGVQNVWVQGVGCGSAVVHFSHTRSLI
jgi:hypothetical protein